MYAFAKHMPLLFTYYRIQHLNKRKNNMHISTIQINGKKEKEKLHSTRIILRKNIFQAGPRLKIAISGGVSIGTWRSSINRYVEDGFDEYFGDPWLFIES